MSTFTALVPLVGSWLRIAFKVAIFSSRYVHLNRKLDLLNTNARFSS
jgi:hypothetical protein